MRSVTAPVPSGKIAANLNFDGGDIRGPTRDITRIGRGKSSVDDVLDRVAALHGHREQPDQFLARGSF